MFRMIMILVLLIPLNLKAAEDAGNSLLAGAAKVNINPREYPVSMTGSFQDRQAMSAHDPLHARALVLQDGQTSIAFVVCDICLISREIFDNAKKQASIKTGIPVRNMLTSATHTHTAPTSVPLAQCNPNPEYVQFLTESIAESIVKAHQRLEPAKVAWAVTEEPGEVNNRRWYVKAGGISQNPFGSKTDKVRMNPPRGSDLLIKPAGPIDPQISILSVQTAKGRPLALLANYSLHYVGGLPANQLSADYFGEFARQIKKRLGADDSFVGMMSNGTSGDINNYNFKEPRPRAAAFERIMAVASVIADRSYAAVNSLDHKSDISLAMQESTIDLAIRKPNQDELAYAKNLLAKAKDPQRLSTHEVYARETVRINDGPDTVNIKLQALRIGELGIVAIPCEVFAEIGLEIKAQSPLKPTFTIGLANGYNGYLPTPEQHDLQGYETWRSGWSYLEKNASDKINQRVFAMLKQVADPTQKTNPNQLTAEEQQQGFKSLFDGKTLKGWKQGGNWKVEDAVITRSGKGGSLVYGDQVLPDDFELKFEWKVAEGSNSGVYYRPGQYEYQILDNKKHPDGKNPRTSAASIYFCMPPSHDATQPVGEWNTGRIVCQGTIIQHWLNGQKVIDLDYTDPRYAWHVGFLANRGGDLAARGAHLSLQDHGDPVWYRGIKLRTIPKEEKLKRSSVEPAKLSDATMAAEQRKLQRIMEGRARQRQRQQQKK